MIRDRLIMGISHSATRARILRDTDCRLERALQTLRLSETSTKEMIQMALESEAVNFTKGRPKKITHQTQIK